MNRVIRMIGPSDYEQAYSLQWEYLDRETFADFLGRVDRSPHLYMVAVDGDDVVGVAYASPSAHVRDRATLQGIAVNLDNEKGYARQGIGSQMLKALERMAEDLGYHAMGVGSADQRSVEAFYLKNGYTPIQLVAKDDDYRELERVGIAGYSEVKTRREELRERYHCREVIIIFHKRLGQRGG